MNKKEYDNAFMHLKNCIVKKNFKLEQNCSIIENFEKFIHYIKNNQVEVSKGEVLGLKYFSEINELLKNPINIKLKRANSKSYPNVLGLFLLLRLTGIAIIKSVNDKKLLIIDNDTYNQYQKINFTEKYFLLLSKLICEFSSEPIGEQFDNFIMVLLIDKIIDLKPNEAIELNKNGRDADYFSGSEIRLYSCLFREFGFIEIIDDKPIEGKGWQINKIITNEYGLAVLNLIRKGAMIFSDSLINLFDDEDEDNEDNEYLHFYYSTFNKIFPELINKIEYKKEKITSGIYVFKVSIGNILREIQISSESKLDDLCRFILKSFNFDYDHLYCVKIKNRFGMIDEYNGCPDMDYAESPTTEDIKIGELSISEGSEMVFVYDFGAYWEFVITLKTIIESKDKKQLKSKPKLLKSEGKAPEQYHHW